jgi:hypothetical protein
LEVIVAGAGFAKNTWSQFSSDFDFPDQNWRQKSRKNVGPTFLIKIGEKNREKNVFPPLKSPPPKILPTFIGCEGSGDEAGRGRSEAGRLLAEADSVRSLQRGEAVDGRGRWK